MSEEARLVVGAMFYACERPPNSVSEDLGRRCFERAAEFHRVRFGPMRPVKGGELNGYEAEVVEVLP